MPELIIWKDRELDKMRRDLEHLMFRLRNDFGMPLITKAARTVPFLELSESENDLIIKAEVPGMNQENLDVYIKDDILTIKGEIKQDFITGDEDYRKIERRRGTFSRSIQLPCRIMLEDVEATYKEDVLNIIMPKCKYEGSRGVKIKIK